MAKLMKSSSMEDGLIGLQHAMMLAQDAHTAFETALQANWVDPMLAEAALVSRLGTTTPPSRERLHYRWFSSLRCRYSPSLNPPHTPITQPPAPPTPSSPSIT
jgi:hypothetical protein